MEDISFPRNQTKKHLHNPDSIFAKSDNPFAWQSREVLHPGSTFSRARPKILYMFASDQDSEFVPGTHTFSFHDLFFGCGANFHPLSEFRERKVAIPAFHDKCVPVQGHHPVRFDPVSRLRAQVIKRPLMTKVYRYKGHTPCVPKKSLFVVASFRSISVVSTKIISERAARLAPRLASASVKCALRGATGWVDAISTESSRRHTLFF
jgi:hypothetical protein